MNRNKNSEQNKYLFTYLLCERAQNNSLKWLINDLAI